MQLSSITQIKVNLWYEEIKWLTREKLTFSSIMNVYGNYYVLHVCQYKNDVYNLWPISSKAWFRYLIRFHLSNRIGWAKRILSITMTLTRMNRPKFTNGNSRESVVELSTHNQIPPNNTPAENGKMANIIRLSLPNILFF